MTERPIIFSGPMVRAILDGRKTQTRRAVKPKYPIEFFGGKGEEGDPRCWGYGPCDDGTWALLDNRDGDSESWQIPCPYGVSGDRLWVRETWGLHRDYERVYETDKKPCVGFLGYLATDDDDSCPKTIINRWRPSIHMPRWASRITLEVVEVRVQRVQDISEADAVAEGCRQHESAILSRAVGYRATFRELWDSLNANRGHGWATNPWVWAITFKRLEGER